MSSSSDLLRELKRTLEFDREFAALDNSIQIQISHRFKKIQEKTELGKPLENRFKGMKSEHIGGWRIVYWFDENYVYLMRCRKRKKSYK